MIQSWAKLTIAQYDEDGIGDRKTMSAGRDTISGGRDTISGARGTISGDRDTMRKSVRASKSSGALRDSRASGYGASIYGASHVSRALLTSQTPTPTTTRTAVARRLFRPSTARVRRSLSQLALI